MKKIKAVILAGGVGSRLWPMSRSELPKQFLNLSGELTMLQETIQRLHDLNIDGFIVICNESHRFLVAEQLRELDKLNHNIILEPVGKNTAPAIALAALVALHSTGQDEILLVLAADHMITDVSSFTASVKNALIIANTGKLVTFGIQPSKPETGYGYIRRGKPIHLKNGIEAFKVEEFVEKPNMETAIEYITSGEYYWNSGMFLFSAARYLHELKKFRPEIVDACQNAITEINSDLDFIRINESSFLACPAESIDYAVMEHTSDAVVLPMDVGWSDIGSWSSLWEISDKDLNGNVFRGDVISHNTLNSYVHSESGLITTIGINDLVVVQTKDALLVADRNNVQDVKKVVDEIKSAGRYEHHTHREVYRPWGKYDSIDSGNGYQVKHITVKPGEGLSLQIHQHRAEHWVIISGKAKVTINDEIKIISENESVFIPAGAQHCLENPGESSLEIIEVRTGSYLDESDIIRLADRYGRI